MSQSMSSRWHAACYVPCLRAFEKLNALLPVPNRKDCSKQRKPVHYIIQDLIMRRFRKVRTSLVPNAAGRVLEIGVGTGLNFPFYSNLEKLWAVDSDKNLLKKASQRARQCSFEVEILQANVEHLPFADSFFDTVVATWIMCSVANPGKAISEIRRVLKNDGVLLFAEHVLGINPVQRAIQNVLTPLSKLFLGNCHLNRDFRAMIKEQGFDFSQRHTFGWQTWSLAPMITGNAQKGSHTSL